MRKTKTKTKLNLATEKEKHSITVLVRMELMTTAVYTWKYWLLLLCSFFFFLPLLNCMVSLLQSRNNGTGCKFLLHTSERPMIEF